MGQDAAHALAVDDRRSGDPDFQEPRENVIERFRLVDHCDQQSHGELGVLFVEQPDPLDDLVGCLGIQELPEEVRLPHQSSDAGE